ncbi:MAG: hypothetical protein EXR07_17385 [Acetobacteraceae bacterium]|nr:hypothetical protein [Acetobacteraceae bacterium]
MQRKIVTLAAACALALQAGIANAEVKTFAKVGGWSAFGGTTDSDRMMCGVSTSGDGRWFGVKYFQNNNYLTVQLSKKSWEVKDGTKIDLKMQFDRETPWSVKATAFHMSDGDAALEFQIAYKEIAQWLTEFQRSNFLYIRFPDSKVDDWKAGLAGTTQISSRFDDCLTALKKATR